MPDISSLDQQMLRLAPYRSPEEISEVLGGTVSPVEVASRVQELLRSRSWLSTLQKKQLLTDKLHELVDTYWTWALQGSLKSTDVVLKGIQEIRKMLAEDAISIEDAMSMISESHAERMGMAMSASFTLLLAELKIPEDQARPLLEKVLQPAFAMIDSAVQPD